MAAHPEYVQPMREEVEAAIREDGWTKSAIDKLRKVDSFLRESQRIRGSGVCMSSPFPSSMGLDLLLSLSLS